MFRFYTLRAQDAEQGLVVLFRNVTGLRHGNNWLYIVVVGENLIIICTEQNEKYMHVFNL